MSKASVIACNSLSKSYVEGQNPVEVLNNISLNVEKGERIAIIGSSGCGKSTLLNLLGGLDTPSHGEVIIANQHIANLNEDDRGKLRNRYLGIVYQFHHLLGEFTALVNVAMPLLIGNYSVAASTLKATEILTCPL